MRAPIIGPQNSTSLSIGLRASAQYDTLVKEPQGDPNLENYPDSKPEIPEIHYRLSLRHC